MRRTSLEIHVINNPDFPCDLGLEAAGKSRVPPVPRQELLQRDVVAFWFVGLHSLSNVEVERVGGHAAAAASAVITSNRLSSSALLTIWTPNCRCERHRAPCEFAGCYRDTAGGLNAPSRFQTPKSAFGRWQSGCRCLATWGNSLLCVENGTWLFLARTVLSTSGLAPLCEPSASVAIRDCRCLLHACAFTNT